MDRKDLIQAKVREKIIQKKLKKIDHLNKKPNGGKRYKKFALIKRYAEDEMN